MKELESFEELVKATIDGELPDGWIYRPRASASALNDRFVVTTSDEDIELDLIEVDGDEIVKALHEAGMAPWIEASLFGSVIRSRERKTGKRDLADIATAVEHYLEHDDFMD